MRYGFKWSIEFCQLDSDGDGKTNGQELGDPDCTWKLSDPSPSNTTLTRPGLKGEVTCNAARDHPHGPRWFKDATHTFPFDPGLQYYYWVASPLSIFVACMLVRMRFLDLSKPRWSIVVLITHLMFNIGTLLCNHRMLAHRAFEVTDPMKFLLCYFGMIAGEGSPVSWAALHRIHHRGCEDGYDPHSPYPSAGNHSNFWDAQMTRCQQPYCGDTRRCGGRTVSDCFQRNVADLFEDDILKTHFTHMGTFLSINFATVGALVAIAFIVNVTTSFKHRYRIVRVLAGTFCWAVFYFILPQTLTYNFTQAVNSALHLWGEEPHHDALSQPCRSKNSALLWVFMLGEKWHNNHHAFPYSATTQIEWYQVDLQFAVYQLMEAFNLAWRYKEKELRSEAMDYQRVEGYEANMNLQILELGIAFLMLTGLGCCYLGRGAPKSAVADRFRGPNMCYTEVSREDVECLAGTTPTPTKLGFV